MDINLNKLENDFEEIKKLMAFNELDRAFKRVLDFANDFSESDTINKSIKIHNQFIRIKKNIKKNIDIDNNEEKLNKLICTVLELIDDIYNEYIYINGLKL